MTMTKIKKVTSERLGEHYFDIEHKSGLRVFVCPKNFSTCFAIFGTRFGGADKSFRSEDGTVVELPAGTAHFLEHKLFENEDGSNSDEHFAALGADDNAYTSSGSTRYLFSASENEYECIAELLRMVQRPYFTAATVKKEQGIIISEIAMGDDSPWTCGIRNMLRGLYKKSNLRDAICGTEESVLSITPEILYKAHRAFYSLSNMALTVVGDVTPEGVIEVLDRELRGIEPREPVISISKPEPNEIECERSEKKMNVARPLFFLGFKDTKMIKDPQERSLRFYGMAALLNLIFSRSYELYNRLITQGLVSPSFSASYIGGRDYAYTVVSGESDDPDRVSELVLEKLRDARAEGLSSEDLERCRRCFKAGFIRYFDSTEEIADDVIMDAWYSDVEPFSVLDTLDALTLDYIEGLLGELCESGHTLSVIAPVKEKI